MVTVKCEDDDKRTIDYAEYILLDLRCRIQSFITNRRTQYVVKYQHRNVSISFDSVLDLCQWVVDNEAELRKNVHDC